MVMNEIYIEVVDRGIRHFALSAEDSWFDWLRSERFYELRADDTQALYTFINEACR